MIDLTALEAALTPIRELGKAELELTVAGTQLVLVPLDPDSERLVQGWSREALQDERGKEKADNSHVEMLEYLDRFKLGVLSYAIVQIGDLDLRETDYIAVGTDDEGKPQRKAKHTVLRGLLAKLFSRPVLLSIFSAYGDLMARIELSTEKAVKYDMVDLDTEISRLEERIKELKALKAGQDRPNEDALSTQIKTAAKQADLVMEANRTLAGGDRKSPESFIAEEVPTEPPTPEPSPEESGVPEAVQAARARSAGRRSAIPDSAPAPSRKEPPPVDLPEPPKEKGPQVMDSFSDATPDALAEESQRLLAQRKKRKKERETTVKPARGRTPPHRQAANTEDAVLDSGGGSLQRATKVGTVDGVEAYRLPGAELSHRGGGDPTPDIKKALINDEGGGGEVNKKFSPRR